MANFAKISFGIATTVLLTYSSLTLAQTSFSNADASAWSNSIAANANQLAVQKAKALNAKGEFEKATSILGGADKTPEVYGSLVINLAQYDLDEAEDIANESIKAFPNNARLHYLRGVVMGSQAQSSIFSALGYAEKSLNSFQKAVELDQEEITYKRALMSFYLAAPSIAGGDEDLGKAQLDAIKMADPLQGVYAEYAFFQMTDEPEKALALLQNSVQTYPQEISLVFRLGVYYSQQEDYDKAMPYFMQASEMPSPALLRDPDTGDLEASYRRNIEAKLSALYQVGRTAVVTEKNTAKGIAAMGALQAATESSQLSPESIPNMNWAMARLSELYIQAGDKSAAKATLASVKVGEDKDLKKQVKRLQKML
ncbi:tetratricopeptide repeat protein [Brumicola blandensis]|uniref:Tetratricopeptide repeat protein n=1 Tax=Brumicola blandensis TaxID=3075611 RepID=A0AAW8R286_9ALTE|nr:hypothetical protein [Alteromonas sp. W409]MDT0582995.1 hypothetical protein [Alteromonas sp. W409]